MSDELRLGCNVLDELISWLISMLWPRSALQDGVVAQQYLKKFADFQRQAKMWTGLLPVVCLASLLHLSKYSIDWGQLLSPTLLITENYAHPSLASAEDAKVGDGCRVHRRCLRCASQQVDILFNKWRNAGT